MSEPTVMRQWIARAKSGDSAAFEQLLALHGRMVLRTAQRLLLNDADAQDAAQEVFLRLHRSLHKFQEERDLIPWLYRITVNICHDQRKRRKPAVTFEETTELAAREANPEQQLNAEERRLLLRAALAGLSDRERDAIVLRDIEGLSTAEVARILGTTETTVRSQISMGRVKLRRRLQESMEKKL
ncbi:MAG TPA: sigma-70 family RNA polymerase sigma factor [Bryobacteraceae bacterium]|jgi:RNA polymerase sigma-70 factor (ECF subfamily)|nr:sigma-70 family RNA polymerase sigma factor [Bryobacteraceae bacterium]